ncbi:LexA family transcriptional regulator [Leuconostoc gelidum subsp. aenigmaticum]|uniref:helix-turn-helix domain-containing protein n=1 Tax=Leuconostoc gelidum TaxID=1244 RepID=UPI001CC63520|nr:XRE family transcriptional regulator [Leuconostoc gelidum]MBZ6004067.1 LexA family transcriptional regulator [Leuconostoc gelidum subsp. aenigmaticum]
MRTNDEIIKLMKGLTEQRGYSISELSRRVDMAKSAVSRYFNGTREFPLNRVNEFAKALGVDPEYILGISEENDISIVYNKLNTIRKKDVYQYAVIQLDEQNNIIAFPEPTRSQVSVYGAVSAGTGEYLLEVTPELVDYEGEVPEHDFAVIVNGDSMEPTFEDKQIIFVKKTHEARNGQFVIANYDHQAYVKKYMRDENGCRLVSLNKKYDDMLIDEEHELSIFGVVVL